jgi:O-antigen ligase
MTRAVTRAEWIWWNAFVAVVMGVGIASADTTGGLLVLVIELMVLLLLGVALRARSREPNAERFRKGWVGVGASVTVGAIIAGTAWLGTGPSLEMVKMDFATDMGALQGLSSEVPEARNEDTRIGIWKNSLRLMADHPIVGTGLGTFPVAYTRYDPGTGSDFINAAHNDYLQLVCETGSIGGLAMGLFLICLAQFSARSLMTGDGLHQAVALGASVGCFGILVHSLVDFHLQNPGTAMLFLMLVALLVCVVKLKTDSLSGFESQG